MSTIQEEIARLQQAKEDLADALEERGITVGEGESLSSFSTDVEALPSVGSVTVQSISVSKSSTSINVGETETITATISPNNATNQTVTWTSSNTAVATVSGGTITAVSAGSATITATSEEGRFTASCSVSSVVPVTGVELAPATVSIGVGETAQLTATVLPSTATNKGVTYSSSDATVATVSATGLVTTVAAGSATITVTTNDGGFTATCAVTSTVVVNYGSIKYTNNFYIGAEVSTDYGWGCSPTFDYSKVTNLAKVVAETNPHMIDSIQVRYYNHARAVAKTFTPYWIDDYSYREFTKAKLTQGSVGTFRRLSTDFAWNYYEGDLAAVEAGAIVLGTYQDSEMAANGVSLDGENVYDPSIDNYITINNGVIWGFGAGMMGAEDSKTIYMTDAELLSDAGITVNRYSDEDASFNVRVEIGEGFEEPQEITVQLQSEDDWEAIISRSSSHPRILCGNRNSDILIPFWKITEINIGTSCTDVGHQFCAKDWDHTSELTSVKNFNRITTAGDSCFYNQSSLSFINDLEHAFEGLETVGNNFCQSVEDGSEVPALTFTNLETVGYNFMRGFGQFSSALSFPQLVSVGQSFLSENSIFNGSVTFSNNLETIGNYFLQQCPYFNQALTIPSSVTSIGNMFMYRCDRFTSTLTVQTSCVPTTQNNNLATNSSSATMYTTGVTLAGPYAQTWKNSMPDRTTSPYRKILIAA